MNFDVMMGPSGWADAADLARRVEQAGFSGMMFTETGQTPWMSIAAAATAAPSLMFSTGVAVAFPMSPMVAASAPQPAAAGPTADATPSPKRPYPLEVDHGRDALLTDFGRETLKDRYLLPGETIQDLFVRVASAYADDAPHAQRLYDYISKLWFMPATPVLSNGGTGRGLPISCYLNSVPDSLEGIVETWNENVWLASLRLMLKSFISLAV